MISTILKRHIFYAYLNSLRINVIIENSLKNFNIQKVSHLKTRKRSKLSLQNTTNSRGKFHYYLAFWQTQHFRLKKLFSPEIFNNPIKDKMMRNQFEMIYDFSLRLSSSFSSFMFYSSFYLILYLRLLLVSVLRSSKFYCSYFSFFILAPSSYSHSSFLSSNRL